VSAEQAEQRNSKSTKYLWLIFMAFYAVPLSGAPLSPYRAPLSGGIFWPGGMSSEGRIVGTGNRDIRVWDENSRCPGFSTP
jgi:hypothetical protein